MPTIAVDKYALYEALGQTYTADEFQALCFDFGIELDQDTEEDPDRPRDERAQLKIEIPANRYDLLCFEGIAESLNIFAGRVAAPTYRVLDMADERMATLTVTPACDAVRPFVAAAILRGLDFTQARYDSFIGLQDKLHMNLARQRTLVSIGTHDLDTITAPFVYDARPPRSIKFVPLNQAGEMTGDDMMQLYEKDKHLGRFLHIIRDKATYPVILDANEVVCSLPPIINGEHSKIRVGKTRNVYAVAGRSREPFSPSRRVPPPVSADRRRLIEITATDRTKLDITMDVMVAAFSRYCEEPFTVEPVRILSEHNGCSRVTPGLRYRTFPVDVAHINGVTGLSETAASLAKLLEKMAYSAEAHGDQILVRVPPTRADVLHAADIVEDVAIAWGYNKLPRVTRSASKGASIGRPLPLNKLADIVRIESAMAGWCETLPLILCSHEENFGWLNREDGGHEAVKLANPKSVEYQVVRTSLLPGLLKTLRENKSQALPLRIFEAADVALQDPTVERKARNERRWAAAYMARTAGFEEVHGLLDRVMAMLQVDFVADDGASASAGYCIQPLDSSTYLPGRSASIMLRRRHGTRRIGEFGVLHPSVVANFALKHPVSVLELNLEVFL